MGKETSQERKKIKNSRIHKNNAEKKIFRGQGERERERDQRLQRSKALIQSDHQNATKPRAITYRKQKGNGMGNAHLICKQ